MTKQIIFKSQINKKIYGKEQRGARQPHRTVWVLLLCGEVFQHNLKPQKIHSL